MITSKLNNKGVITITARFPKKYNFNHGRKVKFEETEYGILITPLFTKEDIKANVGCLGLKGKMLRSLMEEKKFRGNIENNFYLFPILTFNVQMNYL